MFQKIINKLNDLRPKQLLMLAAIAGLLMFITIIVGMNMMTKQEVAIIPPPIEEEKPVIQTTQVVVAKVNIPPRTRIQESMLQMKELPVDMVPEGAIESFDAVKNVQVRVSIFSGDILTIQKVFSESTDEGFVGEIPADCRAISINVNEVTGVGGFAKPGDKVDLLLVESDKYNAVSNILLQNVLLLSVNQDTTQTGNVITDEGIAKPSAIHNPSIATFALPPEDILKLIAATKLGEIYMMLRPSNPRANYVPEMEYALESISKPKPEPVQTPTPVIPSNVPLPEIPANALEPVVPKIDIIAGDQIVQSSTPNTPTTTTAPTITGRSSSALPAIPSGTANPSVTIPNTPLTNTPIVNQITSN
ncbi:MAG: Flp pilus assembly protein CpaB [Selenomonadaceae bacterium]|nr:Flp pilus assembly protein CpaB [Selenomonadaceae bacterium]